MNTQKLGSTHNIAWNLFQHCFGQHFASHEVSCRKWKKTFFPSLICIYPVLLLSFTNFEPFVWDERWQQQRALNTFPQQKITYINSRITARVIYVQTNVQFCSPCGPATPKKRPRSRCFFLFFFFFLASPKTCRVTFAFMLTHLQCGLHIQIYRRKPNALPRCCEHERAWCCRAFIPAQIYVTLLAATHIRCGQNNRKGRCKSIALHLLAANANANALSVARPWAKLRILDQRLNFYMWIHFFQESSWSSIGMSN